MNLTDAMDTLDTLNKQHEQIKSIIYSLNANEHFADISKVIVTGNLWAAGDLIEQAQKTTDDLYELIKQQGDSKPEATVMSKTPTTIQAFVDLGHSLSDASEIIAQSEAILGLINSDDRLQEKTFHDLSFSLWAALEMMPKIQGCMDKANRSLNSLTPDGFDDYEQKRVNKIMGGTS